MMSVFDAQRKIDTLVVVFDKDSTIVAMYDKSFTALWIYNYTDQEFEYNHYIPERVLPKKGVFVDKLNAEMARVRNGYTTDF